MVSSVSRVPVPRTYACFYCRACTKLHLHYEISILNDKPKSRKFPPFSKYAVYLFISSDDIMLSLLSTQLTSHPTDGNTGEKGDDIESFGLSLTTMEEVFMKV